MTYASRFRYKSSFLGSIQQIIPSKLKSFQADTHYSFIETSFHQYTYFSINRRNDKDEKEMSV